MMLTSYTDVANSITLQGILQLIEDNTIINEKEELEFTNPFSFSEDLLKVLKYTNSNSYNKIKESKSKKE